MKPELKLCKYLVPSVLHHAWAKLFQGHDVAILCMDKTFRAKIAYCKEIFFCFKFLI